MAECSSPGAKAGTKKWLIVGVLSDPEGLTCSRTAVDQYLAGNPDAHWRLRYFESFDDMRAALDVREIDIAVVPAAVPDANAWLFEFMPAADKAFWATIPGFVVCGVVPERAAKPARRVYVLPALTNFVAAKGLDEAAVTLAGNNEDAARKLLADDDPTEARAITNTTVAQHFGLHVYAAVKPATLMIFILFGSDRWPLAGAA